MSKPIEATYPIDLFADSYISYMGFEFDNELFNEEQENLSDIEQDMQLIDNLMKTINYYVQSFFHNRRYLNEHLKFFNGAIHHKETSLALIQKMEQLKQYLVKHELFNEVLRLNKALDAINSFVDVPKV